MISLPSRSGRIARRSSSASIRAIRSSSRSYERASAAARRLLRVVQSDRTSLCSRGSSGPASVTYRRTAESVHSPRP